MEQPSSFEEYRALFSREFNAHRLREAEPAVDYPRSAQPDERLAQCIWYDSMFVHRGLETDGGQSLEILKSGNWNQSGGPDFRDALLKIGGERRSGDVEIHLHGNGWRQHRHQLDPAYDNVILHAYLWEDSPPAEPCRNSRGESIAEFCMQPRLFPDFESICQTVQVEDYPYQAPSSLGACHGMMCSMEESLVQGLLDSAGRERMEGKMRRFADQAGGAPVEQVLYQALMTSMGHKSNKGLFFLLSKRVPLLELLDYFCDFGPGADAAQAELFFESVLLHVANLVPPAGSADCDAETRAHLEQLSAVWKEYAGYYSDRLIPETKQWQTGVRPVNFPQRRLGGIARLLARLFLGEGVLERFGRLCQEFPIGESLARRRQWLREELIRAFVVDAPDCFWTHRYNFTAKRAARPMKPIGEDRAASIVLNALLPILLHHARQSRQQSLEEKLWQIYAAYPPLESNSMIRHMRRRLFGEHPRGNELLKGECSQQGLFQIFSGCCNHNVTGCEDCFYLQRHGALGIEN